MVICLERGADLHTTKLMPLPLTVSCFSKIQIGFTFLVPAYPGSPGKGLLNGCVCVCVFYLPCTSLPRFSWKRVHLSRCLFYFIYWTLPFVAVLWLTCAIFYCQWSCRLAVLSGWVQFCEPERCRSHTASDAVVLQSQWSVWADEWQGCWWIQSWNWWGWTWSTSDGSYPYCHSTPIIQDKLR